MLLLSDDSGWDITEKTTAAFFMRQQCQQPNQFNAGQIKISICSFLYCQWQAIWSETENCHNIVLWWIVLCSKRQIKQFILLLNRVLSLVRGWGGSEYTQKNNHTVKPPSKLYLYIVSTRQRNFGDVSPGKDRHCVECFQDQEVLKKKPNLLEADFNQQVSFPVQSKFLSAWTKTY